MKKMKGLVLLAMMSLTLVGCGPSKKDLASLSHLLGQAQNADCNTVKAYLAQVKTAIDEKIK